MHGSLGLARDYDALSELLTVLAYPARLELLDVLRDPRTLAEIRVGARRGAAGSMDRPASKQSVAAHLEKLVAAGFVRAEERKVGGRVVPLYGVVPSRLYALIEELRGLSVLHAGKPSTDLTGTVGMEPRTRDVAGPHLVLVHGVYEGKVFPLEGVVGEQASIGRGVECRVQLDYDHYVSGVNSHLEWTKEGIVIVDDSSSKNGTSVNWRRLGPGERRVLTSGDLIEVGRSRLLFLDR